MLIIPRLRRVIAGAGEVQAGGGRVASTVGGLFLGGQQLHARKSQLARRKVRRALRSSANLIFSARHGGNWRDDTFSNGNCNRRRLHHSNDAGGESRVTGMPAPLADAPERRASGSWVRAPSQVSPLTRRCARPRSAGLRAAFDERSDASAAGRHPSRGSTPAALGGRRRATRRGPFLAGSQAPSHARERPPPPPPRLAMVCNAQINQRGWWRGRPTSRRLSCVGILPSRQDSLGQRRSSGRHRLAVLMDPPDLPSIPHSVSVTPSVAAVQFMLLSMRPLQRQTRGW